MFACLSVCPLVSALLLQDGFARNVVSGILGNCVEGLHIWLLGTLHEDLNVYRIVGSDVYCNREETLCSASMATLSIFIFDSDVYTSIIQRERIVIYPGNNAALFLYCLTFFFPGNIRIEMWGSPISEALRRFLVTSFAREY
jgi:hypothetical protein